MEPKQSKENALFEWYDSLVFALAVIVPVLIRLSTMWVPRLFPADKLLLAIANFLCALGVLIDTDQSVRAAGGYLVQLMPGATDDMIDKIEAGIQKAGAVSKLLDEGMDGKGLLETVLSEFELEILEQTPVAYRCYCSRERVTRTLISLGRKELQDIVDEGKPIDIDCQFCDEIYHYTPADIADILKEL